MRLTLALVLSCCALLPAEDAAPAAAPAPAASAKPDYLAAARAADQSYRLRFDRLVADLVHADPQVRMGSIRVLSQLADPMAVIHLVPLLEPGARDAGEQALVCTALARLEATGAMGAIRAHLQAQDAQLRTAAFNAIARLEGLGPADLMQRAKQDDQEALRRASLVRLAVMNHADAAALLVQGLQEGEDVTTRRLCAYSLGRMGDKAHAPVLRKALCDGNPQVRIAAARALVQLDDKTAILDLLMALESNVAGAELSRALKALAGDDFGFDARANVLQRQTAIERGYAWWAQHPELKGP